MIPSTDGRRTFGRDFSDRLAAVADACVRIAAQRHRSPLAPDVVALSALFTSDRGSRAKTYMRDPALRRAYLGFFVPHNVARISLLLGRLAEEGALGALAHNPAPRIVDVGAGPLSALLAAWVVWGKLGPSVAVDISRAALEDGAAVLEAVGADVAALALVERSVRAQPRPWLNAHGAAPDLIIAANVLNEISDPRQPDERVEVVGATVRGLAAGGRFLIVEPALRVEARALMAVRDEVHTEEIARLYSPCRGAATCPLLATHGDWCHGDVVWSSRPPAYRALEAEVGFPKDVLASSHLLLGRPDDREGPVTGLRLVGGVMRADLERRYACGRELVTLAAPRLPPTVRDALRGAVVDDNAVAVAPTAERRGPSRAPASTPARSDRGARAPAPPPTPRRPPSKGRRSPPRG